MQTLVQQALLTKTCQKKINNTKTAKIAQTPLQ